MLNLPPTVRIFVCTEPADMRRSFDGLSAMAEQVVQRQPLSGHLFVFRNKRADRLKILYWDRDGYAIWYKRLEKGTFLFPEPGEDGSIEVKPSDLMMILEGIDIQTVQRGRRFTLDRSVLPAEQDS